MSNLEKRAALDFVLTLRRRWADTLYPRLHEEYEAARADGPADAAERIHHLPTYGGFAWLERGSQKMLWRAAMDAVQARPRRRPRTDPVVRRPWSSIPA